MPKCMREGCNKPAVINLKGLCMTDYSQAKKMVEAGETTWEELERMCMVDSKKVADFKTEFLRRKTEQQAKISNDWSKTGFE